MAHPGTLHRYAKKLTAFEHAPQHSSSTNNASNLILWIGGLGDGPLSVHYPTAIAKALPSNWSLAEVLLSSAYDGWGTGSLARDAKEIASCVSYFKDLRHSIKIVLMGHSTGSQDLMEYLVGPNSDSHIPVEGAIFQAGVSDRQGWAAVVADDEELKKSLKDTIELAKKWVEQGDGDAILQRKGNKMLEMFESPCTAYRANSLLSYGGDDDYFSTDFPDEVYKNTFGKIPKNTAVMFLWGSEDPYIPTGVDKWNTLKKWAGFVKEGGAKVDEANGGVVKGATHNLNGDPEDVVQDLVQRVVRFVEGI
ncbi:DUF1749-domain-containing protein [Bimuria novae-zelandiae CBS 107.79]|uniref:DUF1749-domain-containing protein n=1 Tax=Bimuria novae-zelandiae CBS 107.79 TaxID=1447943 RepID=A0A6A5V236_9PLEO|nr:DUF1749-domain-containing protein [Bimuria novae-zelandiae CBS 107.79]